MRSLFLILAIFISTNVDAHQTYYNHAEVLGKSTEAILTIKDGQTFIKPEKLMFLQGEWFLQNDLEEWTLLECDVFKEVGGFVLGEPKCPKGHTGIVKKWGTWYCMREKCPYFIGDNF
ncbi:MAG: hypothetical protein ACOYK9_04345 [Chlamydiia bacterium]